jgi:hypothetical protein
MIQFPEALFLPHFMIVTKILFPFPLTSQQFSLGDVKMSYISFCLSFTTSFALCNGAVGPHLFIILYLSCSGIQKNGLSNSSLITVFSAILIFLKTLQNGESRQHSV